MCINFLTEDNKLICGVNWYKIDMSGNTGHYELVCYNANKKDTDLQAAGKVLKSIATRLAIYTRKTPGIGIGDIADIRKEGSKLTFFYWGGYPSFTVPEIEDMKCTKIQIAIKQWGTRSGSRYLTI